MNGNFFKKKYGTWALIAGASEGIGEAYACELAAMGLNLVLVARREALLKDLAAKLEEKFHISVKTIVLDLALTDRISEIFDLTSGLDIGLLVYNAALSLIGPFGDHPLEEHLKEIDINCKGTLCLAYLFGSRFKERGGGGIILMSSLSSSLGSPLLSNYAATKAWNMVLGEGLWYEFKPHGIDVLACAPAAVDTPNYRRSGPRGGTKTMDPVYAVKTALRHLGKKPVSIPGLGNNLADFIIRRILPRKSAIGIMGKTLFKMYGK